MELTEKLTTQASKVLSQTYLLLMAMIFLTGITTAIALALGFTVESGANYFLLAGIGFAMIFVAAMRNAYLALGALVTFSIIKGFLLTMAISVVSLDTILLAGVLTLTMFALLSSYVLVTGKDFSGIGNYLLGALVLLIIAMIANIFIGSSMVHLGLSYVTVLIFGGMILYDTSMIVSGKETNPVLAALGLYLNLINVFLSLLNILGSDD